jgi:FMN phosphatase YigB (HAD superfamily)
MKYYVCLDIGNVLCHVDFNVFLADVSESLNVTTEDAMYFLNRSQKLHDLGLTVMKDELRDHLKIKSQVTIDKLLLSWNNCITPNYKVLDMFNNLTEKFDFQVALLSNIGLEHSILMEKVLDHGPFFENALKHFSCYVGARKPTSLFYQSFLWDHPEFKGCVYVDDVVENLETGSKFGFRPYHLALDSMSVEKELLEIEKAILAGPSNPCDH